MKTMKMVKVVEYRGRNEIRRYGITAKGEKSLFRYARERLSANYIQEIHMEMDGERYMFAKVKGSLSS